MINNRASTFISTSCLQTSYCYCSYSKDKSISYRWCWISISDAHTEI